METSKYRNMTALHGEEKQRMKDKRTSGVFEAEATVRLPATMTTTRLHSRRGADPSILSLEHVKRNEQLETRCRADIDIMYSYNRRQLPP